MLDPKDARETPANDTAPAPNRSAAYLAPSQSGAGAKVATLLALVGCLGIAVQTWLSQKDLPAHKPTEVNQSLGQQASASQTLPRVAPLGSGDFAGAPTVTRLKVPYTDTKIVIDGNLEEGEWSSSVARSGAFVDPQGSSGNPYSDARFLWSKYNLYIALYAADEDLQASPRSKNQSIEPTDDVFHFELGVKTERYVFEINPMGIVHEQKLRNDGSTDSNWHSGLKVGHDIDGTLNNATDDDEEWVLEIALPLASLGLTPNGAQELTWSVRRCDTPHRLRPLCNVWGTELTPHILVLAPNLEER
jgi:hypothetical protein